MTELECLSLMELLDIRADAADAAARAHLAACKRCQALLNELPVTSPGPLAAGASSMYSTDPRVASPAPEVKTGHLWRAQAAADADWSWVVAIIGRSPHIAGGVVVAPVFGGWSLATEDDLVLPESIVGYPAFVDLGNVGTLFEWQLTVPTGRLDPRLADALVGLYRALLGAGSRPEASTGAPVVGADDERLLASEERGQALRALWRAVDEQVDEPEVVDLPALLRSRIEGEQADWERTSLLEATGIDVSHYSGFTEGRLDLTDKRDLGDLALVLHELEVPWADARPVVEVTLRSSAGGQRFSAGLDLPLAARSRPGMSEDEIADELYGDVTGVDTSVPARQLEIEAYLAELRQALDDLA